MAQHINASTVLQVFYEDNFRADTCTNFNQAKSCIVTYIKNREICMKADGNEFFLKIVMTLYETMCSDNFENLFKGLFFCLLTNQSLSLVQKQSGAFAAGFHNNRFHLYSIQE